MLMMTAPPGPHFNVVDVGVSVRGEAVLEDSPGHRSGGFQSRLRGLGSELRVGAGAARAWAVGEVQQSLLMLLM